MAVAHQMSQTNQERRIAIKASNVRKVFRLYNSPLDLVLEKLTGQPRHRKHLALDDVSLEIYAGETVGIIGRNGAGKSTLLKIIAGVLDCDHGEVQVKGQVSALLELGSGFNPEYTGRENILFGGMCLGMTREEVLRKTDEIIAFAELQDAIDQPLKTYSSGMQSRLAFATATAVNADVLIVDEALSVGDVFFQEKCMERMRQMQQSGTTILFVSHSPDSVNQLCDRAILLDNGKVTLDSDSLHVTERYFNSQLEGHSVNKAPPAAALSSVPQTSSIESVESCIDTCLATDNPDAGRSRFEKEAQFERVSTGEASFYNVQLFDAMGRMRSTFEHGEEVTLRMIFRISEPIDHVMFHYAIRTPQGVAVVWADTRPYSLDFCQLDAEALHVLDWNFRLSLQHGNFIIRCGISIPSASTAISDWRFVDVVPRACFFSMLPNQKGMLAGLVSWDNDVSLYSLATTPKL